MAINRAIVLAVFGLVLNACAEVRAADVLRVGVIGGFSGPYKAYGVAPKQGFELGLKDQVPAHVKAIFEDDQFSPAMTVTAFKKLLDIDQVDLVVVLSSTTAHAVVPLAEEAKIPVIAWASDPSVAIGKTFVIRAWVSAEKEGAKIAAEASQRNLSAIGLLTATSDYTKGVGDGFKQHTPAGRVVIEDEYPADAQDFKAFLLKARVRKADSFALCLNPGQSGVFAAQARSLGISVPLFGCENFHDREENRIAHGALTGAWFVTGGVTEAFRDRYLREFGNDNVLSGAAVMFDTAQLLSRLPVPHRLGQELVEAIMHAPEVRGAMGSLTPRTENGDQYFDIRLVVKQVTDSGFSEMR